MLFDSFSSSLLQFPSVHCRAIGSCPKFADIISAVSLKRSANKKPNRGPRGIQVTPGDPKIVVPGSSWLPLAPIFQTHG